MYNRVGLRPVFMWIYVFSVFFEEESKYKTQGNVSVKTAYSVLIFLIPDFMMFFEDCLWIKFVLSVAHLLQSDWNL